MSRMFYFWTIAVPLLISIAISIFGQDLRVLFGKGLNSFLVRRNQYLLDQLERTHGSAYELLLWLCLQLELPLLETLMLGLLALQMWVHHNPVVFLPLSIIIGNWIATWQQVYSVLNKLRNYEKASAKLRERIAARAARHEAAARP